MYPYSTKQFLATCTLLLLLLFNSVTSTAANSPILDYQPTFIPGYDADGKLAIAIRSYSIDNTPYFLLVNPNTLQTSVLPAANFKPRSNNPQAAARYYTMAAFKNTPYFQALAKYSSPPYSLQNYGLTHANGNENGMFLTVDMCPSSKPFEKEFFESLIALTDKTGKSTPVTLAMSGLWMINHPNELNWLIEQQNNHKLTITWANHSFSHTYYRDLPLNRNFMLIRPDDFNYEVLATEKLLLQKGLVPSVFFRYPGLVANKELLLKLNNLGLIPLGSDAWLAKNQTPIKGSIILVHGNSNEHVGIVDFMKLLQQGDLKLLPLQQAVAP